MKDRILKGWNLTRGLYTVLGAFILWQSVINVEWLGIFLGGYIASMGIFSFGCASGTCMPSGFGRSSKENPSGTEEITCEEIK